MAHPTEPPRPKCLCADNLRATGTLGRFSPLFTRESIFVISCLPAKQIPSKKTFTHAFWSESSLVAFCTAKDAVSLCGQWTDKTAQMCRLICVRPNKKVWVFRVTLPYLNFLVKPSIFFLFYLNKTFMLTIRISRSEQTVIRVFVWFGLSVALNNLSVISEQCLDVAGSSMLIFKLLPHWNIRHFDMIFHPVTLYWH